MVDQLSPFADEVTRVAREVGTEGRLGGQADVHDVSGTWKDLTENVNMMAANLTSQVRNIAEVTTAVAQGDLTSKITVDARGEILELKSTVNTMVDQLSSFADEVTRVAREVGTEGMLGGQARVPGVGRHLARPDRLGELDGLEPDQPGAQHRHRVDRRRAGRPSQKIPSRPGARSPRWPAPSTPWWTPCGPSRDEVTRVAREVGTEGILRRPGPRPRRRRHLEGPHRLGELDGGQLDQPGAEHRARHHGGGARRPDPEDVRRRPRRDPRAQDDRQPHGGPALRPSRTR